MLYRNITLTDDFPFIGTRRELFWDDYMVDTELTTAEYREHELIERGPCFTCSEEYDGGESKPQKIVKWGDGYRIYYEAYNMYPNGRDGGRDFMNRRLGVIESKDGVNWTAPILNEVEYKGSKANNLAISCPASYIDNPDPNAPSEKKYITVRHRDLCDGHNGMFVYFSPDGVNFTEGPMVVRWKQQCFDADNKIRYNAERGVFQVYFRAFHSFEDRSREWWVSHKMGIRDIRYTESTDLEHWSEPKLIEFQEGAGDYPLYTNNINFYYRAPHIYYGLATRYTERHTWTAAFERLTGKEERLDRMKEHQRYGKDITDLMFMTSRDGEHFRRSEEAIATGGPEYPLNWIYGDCFFCETMIETPARFEGQDPELSLYASNGDWMFTKAQFIRYTIRIDGFASRHAGGKVKTLMTKPFRFSGDQLEMNFKTAGGGFVQVSICDLNGRPFDGYQSACLFGDKIDRVVDFPYSLDLFTKNDIPVRLRFDMAEADVYSFKFNSTDGTDNTEQHQVEEIKKDVLKGHAQV